MRRLHRRPGRLDLHPDRHQPRQRLLRRPRGADTADRLGPGPGDLGGAGRAAAGARRDLVAFGVAVACGIYLATVAGSSSSLVGAASIAAGVLYTGGPRPYGYAGLGEVFVFLFFGLVAVNGSYYVQVEQLDALPLGLSIAVGFLATAILVVNNVRDIETDRRAGKMTLAVRMGRANAVALYRMLVLGAYVVLPIALLAGEAQRAAADRPALAAAGDPPDAGDVHPHRRPALNGALAGTGALLGVFSLLVSLGLLISPERPVEGSSAMRIASVEVIPYALPFREPYVTARGQPRPARDGAAAAARRGRAGRARAKRCRSRCAAARL